MNFIKNYENMKLRFIIVFVCIIAVFHINAQERDSIAPIRDNIGDLNASYIKNGQFPGAIMLPGTEVSLAIGGFIKAVGFYDTKYNQKNEIILPGTFIPSQFEEGQTYFGARSSRLFFDGRSTLGGVNVEGYFEMDFRGASGFTLRHAYLQLSNLKGQKLLMGQYWSLIMDLQTVAEGLVEPTLSGGGFSRHGQIRFTTPLSKSLTFSASLEEPNNSDLKGVDIIPVNKYPDVIGSISFDPSSAFHLSITGMYKPATYKNQSNGNLNTEGGWLTGAGIVFRPSERDKITLAGIYGAGASNYIMGTDGTSGYYDQTTMELQDESGFNCSYKHNWNEKFRSNIALGRFFGDEITNNPNPHIKTSTYGFINTYYQLNRYVNIGIEWVYSEKENYRGSNFNNNRFQFGIQVF